MEGLRLISVKAHPRRKSKGSSPNGRTAKTASYEASMKRRFIVEGTFGWIKDEGRLRQTKLRGTRKVNWELHLFAAAFILRDLAHAQG